METRTTRFWQGFRPFSDQINSFTTLSLANRCTLFQGIDCYIKSHYPYLYLHMIGNKVVLSVWREATYFLIVEQLVQDAPSDIGFEVEALVPSCMDRELYLKCADGTDEPIALFGVPVQFSSLYCELEPDPESPGQFIVTVFHPELYGLTDEAQLEQLGTMLQDVVGEWAYGIYFSELRLCPIVRNRTEGLIPLYRLVGDFWWEG